MDTVNIIDSIIDSSFEELLNTNLTGSEEVTTVNDNSLEEELTTTGEGPKEVEPFIKPNSGSELVDETTTRFSGAVWYKKIQDLRIIIAGIGGIGSWLALLIARMHPRSLYLVDPDTVEAVNMAGQLYGNSDIGSSKVRAMYKRITDLCNWSVAINAARFNSGMCMPIMICGFDNMAARKDFYFAWKEYTKRRVEACTADSREDYLFLDGRIKC